MVTETKGISTSYMQKPAWNLHFNTAYKDASVGIYDDTYCISGEQKQAYAAGHWEGHKVWRMKNLLKKS